MVNKKHASILNKYSEIWDKLKELIGKDLRVEVVHKNKDITTTVKSYNIEI